MNNGLQRRAIQLEARRRPTVTREEYQRAQAYVVDRLCCWTREDYEDGGARLRSAEETVAVYEEQQQHAKAQQALTRWGEALDAAMSDDLPP